MKYFKIFTILLFSLFLFSCKEKDLKKDTEKPIEVINISKNNYNNTNSSNVFHFICSKGCTGGSAAKGNCSSCGNPLVHNKLFHSKPKNSPTPSVINNSNNVKAPANSAQNAKGVWHYSCSKGCSGGAGIASPCSSCGSALTHNTAYHQ